jgi:pilus assembly protein FimV
VQSANFNEFRRRLAEAAPAQQVATADRQASGRVQPNVEEKRATTPSPDKLTLSKGSVKGAAPETQIAQSRQGKDEKERVAELSKNINELSRLQDKVAVTGSAAPASASRGPTVAVAGAASAPKVAASTAPVTAPPSAPATAAPAVVASATSSVKPGTVTAPAPTSAAAASASAAAVASAAKAAIPAPVASAQTAVSSTVAIASTSTGAPIQPAASAASAAGSAPAASTSAAPASAPASAPAPRPKVAPIKPPQPEPSLLDDLLENPVVPAAAGGLLALLAGFAFYRARQRKKSSQVDSSFLESRMQPDSFFGSSGGQRIDTADEAPTGSSLAYSPSQLDAAGDVDPVAEADVYLAYGRDLQAEEILKEALRMNPSRIAIHGKLLEIFAKRRDVRAFEALAADAFKLCAGEGAEWERICEFGRELDHDNPLYQPGGRPKSKAETTNAKESVAPVFASSTIPVAPHPDFAPSSSMPVDLDLGDLDLSFDSPTSAPAAHPVAPQAERVEGVISGPVPLDVELSWDALSTPVPEIPSAPPASTSLVAADQASAPAAAQTAAETGMIEFDLGSLSLDLDRSLPADETPASLPHLHGSDPDPLETKLALAQEFQSIGDSDGARTLVEEVVARAGGPLKAKAQRFLAELG